MLRWNFLQGHDNLSWYDNYFEEFLKTPTWEVKFVNEVKPIRYRDQIGIIKNFDYINYFKRKTPTKVMIENVINDLHNTRKITKNIFKYD